MAFKVSSLLVWLLATTATITTVLHRVAAQCDEVLTCEADAVCGEECWAVGETFNQVFEDCMNADPVAFGVCERNIKTACCQTLGSDTDCFANSLYVEAWWCTNNGGCEWSYPTVQACTEFGVLGVTSGGVGSSADTVESPAPTAAAGNCLFSEMFFV